MTELVKIHPGDLVDMAGFTGRHPVKIDIVYAQPQHHENIFKCKIYRPDAKMWAHRELAPVILRAADICYAQHKYIFELKDCLRTTEAQALVVETDLVKANPRWLEEPGRLFAPPGKGGHPRGMAIDLILVTENGDHVDMGTPFDYLTTDPNDNPAARDYAKFPAQVLKNRKILEESMLEAAQEYGRELYPLPQEWWDFRFMPDYYNTFAPLSDADLPAHMKMT